MEYAELCRNIHGAHSNARLLVDKIDSRRVDDDADAARIDQCGEEIERMLPSGPQGRPVRGMLGLKTTLVPQDHLTISPNEIARRLVVAGIKEIGRGGLVTSKKKIRASKNIFFKKISGLT
jgi:hypothetical protein